VFIDCHGVNHVMTVTFDSGFHPFKVGKLKLLYVAA